MVVLLLIFLRKLHNAFLKSCKILHPHLLVLISPHPHKHLFISFFDNSNLNGCEVLFYYDFDLHFPD